MINCNEKFSNVAVIIHSHNLATLKEVMKYVDNLTPPFDVYLNFSEILKENEVLIRDYKKKIEEEYPLVTFYYTTSSNRGTDSGGFFSSTKKAFSCGKKGYYDYVCKLHTKSGGEQLVGWGCSREEWKVGMLRALLKDKSHIKKIFNIFSQYSNVGCITSAKFYCDDFIPHKNLKNYTFLADKLALNEEARWPKNEKFAAGTMFWIRGDVWDYYMDKDITINDFEIGFSNDGLRTHAMERIYDAVVRNLGYGVWLHD